MILHISIFFLPKMKKRDQNCYKQNGGIDFVTSRIENVYIQNVIH